LRRIRYEENYQRHHRKIEGIVREGQGHGVGVHKGHALQQWLLPAIGELRLRRVDADELERFALLSDQLGEGTIAAAHIQRS
jgi:hypothetical protein